MILTKKTLFVIILLLINRQIIAAEPNSLNASKQIQIIKNPDSNLVKNNVSAAEFCDSLAPFIKEFVNPSGKVNYKALKKKRSDLVVLLKKFSDLEPNVYSTWTREDKIAFWLNAYNLHLMKIIIDNYPIESTRVLRIIWPPDSIRHIKGIWDEYKFIIMDEEFTLHEIDQRFFRKEFNEPRVFFGVSYACLSSPAMRNEPYYGTRIIEQLDDQAKKYLNSQWGFKIDREKQKVYLSSILDTPWYGQYFMEKYGTEKKFKEQQPVARAVLNFIIHYIPEGDVNYLETGNYTVEYMLFNWRLNDF